MTNALAQVLLPDDVNKLIKGLQQLNKLSLYSEILLVHYDVDLQTNLLPALKKSLKDDYFDCVNSLSLINSFQDKWKNYISGSPGSEKIFWKFVLKLSATLKLELFDSLKAQIKDLFLYILNYFLEEKQLNLEQNLQMVEEINEFKRPENNLNSKRHFVTCIAKETITKHIFQCKFLADEVFNFHFIMPIMVGPIEDFIKTSCCKEYDDRLVGFENCFVNKVRDEKLIPFLQYITSHYNPNSCYLPSNSNRQFSYNQNLLVDNKSLLNEEMSVLNYEILQKQLNFILYNCFTRIRIKEFLTIVFGYPDTKNAVEDVKICLEYTGLRPLLIKTLTEDMNKRVLHPGTKTQFIIQAYISTVKALRDLDPSGVVLEIVLEPVQKYLKNRPDSVKQIMNDLLNQSEGEKGDLAIELTNQVQENKSDLKQSWWHQKITASPFDWSPDPRESDPLKVSSVYSTREQDIVSLFISMYGSKEKFIKEYQKLVSKRLQQAWFNGEDEAAEIRNLELFKIRFGEEEVSKCSVMFKDFADSKRIYSNYEKRDKIQEEVSVVSRPFIISEEFWPQMQDSELELPENIQKSFDVFKKEFTKQKPSRLLKIKKNIGLVELELEFADNITKSYKVTPILASIISTFDDTDKRKLSELSEILKLTPTLIRKKIVYWVQQGVLRSVKGEPDTYAVNDVISNTTANEESFSMEKEDEDEEKNEEKIREDEEMMWNYMCGMFQNFGNTVFTIERLRSMMSMLLPDSDQNLLPGLLNRKVMENKLTFTMQGREKSYRLVTD